MNRYNKEFFPFRLTVDGKLSRKPLSNEQLARIERNRSDAVAKLHMKKSSTKTLLTDWQARAKSNQRTALAILEAKKARLIPLTDIQIARARRNRLAAVGVFKAKQSGKHAGAEPPPIQSFRRVKQRPPHMLSVCHGRL